MTVEHVLSKIFKAVWQFSQPPMCPSESWDIWRVVAGCSVRHICSGRSTHQSLFILLIIYGQQPKAGRSPPPFADALRRFVAECEAAGMKCGASCICVQESGVGPMTVENMDDATPPPPIVQK